VKSLVFSVCTVSKRFDGAEPSLNRSGIGLAVVTQNIISSQFNSSLLDSTNGWAFVLEVGFPQRYTLRRSLAYSSATGYPHT
jgi:hypothetical protein